ncbi:hypothetical protein ACIQPR_28890 [Streptomyces sp. NPDC091280]|uniref:hypothetical protein n=1 Tax=Streptomyces sp. NPDC091280 TaxID=3365984 RepID=UPI0037FD7DA8
MADPPGRVTRRLRALAASSADGLGWYTGLLAEAPNQVPYSAAEYEVLVARTIRLGAAGLSPPQDVARLLRTGPPSRLPRLVRMLERMIAAGQPARDVWAALALCGEPGLARLDQVVRTERDMEGAARALHEVDPARATDAIRERVLVRDLPVRSVDAGVLKGLTEQDVSLLAENYRRGPADPDRATVLAWTGHRLAKDILVGPEFAGHHDPAVRSVALRALGMRAGFEPDDETDECLLRAALADPIASVRVVARTMVQVRAAHSPTTQAFLDRRATADGLLEEPVLLPVTEGVDAFLTRLSGSGPGHRLVLEMLRQHPELLSAPADGAAGERIAHAVDTLVREALEGRRGLDTVTALCDIRGPAFVSAALDALDHDAAGRLHTLALGLLRAAPGREDVFVAGSRHAGLHPHPLTGVAIVLYDLAPGRRAELLLRLLEQLSTPRPEAVRVWSAVLYQLLSQCDDTERLRLRPRITAATERILLLLPTPSSTQKAPDRPAPSDDVWRDRSCSWRTDAVRSRGAIACPRPGGC